MKSRVVFRWEIIGDPEKMGGQSGVEDVCLTKPDQQIQQTAPYQPKQLTPESVKVMIVMVVRLLFLTPTKHVFFINFCLRF